MTTMTMATATKTALTPRAKTDAFLSKVEVISRPRVLSNPKPVTEPTTKAKHAPPKKIKLITPKEYWEDAKTRWAIHTLHWGEFIEDCKWVINKTREWLKPYIEKAKPYVKKAIDKVKDWYKKIQE